MSQVITQDFGALIRQEQEKTSLATVPAGQVPINYVRPAAEARLVALRNIEALESAWRWMFQNHIHPAIEDQLQASVSEGPLRNLIHEFDLAMVSLAPVRPRKVSRTLEQLAQAMRPVRKRWFVDRIRNQSKRELRRRERIRDCVERVEIQLANMKHKVTRNPAWLKRIVEDAWTGVEPVMAMNPEQIARAESLAKIMIIEPALKLGDKILPPDVAAAFRTLDLEPWRKREDMLENHRKMIKVMHTDVPGGNPKLAAEINAARDRLNAFFSVTAPKRPAGET
jgi:hypothetical protein